MKSLHKLAAFLLIFLFVVTSLYSQYPKSKEATLIESVSSAEVLVEATGIYKSKEKSDRKARKQVEKKGVSNAVKDAKKSAVYFVLFGGTDPLISTTEERQKFEPHVAFFFNTDNISRYISWEETTMRKKVKISGGKGIKVTKRFKVNKEILSKDLESYNILAARADLADAIGNPFIMVIPATGKGENPIELLQTDPKVRHAASVVESYLTARRYDVVVPEQQANLEDLTKAQQSLADQEEDYAYQLALSIGCDVYITFAGAVEKSGYGTEKYSLISRAYETTTARLLGTETGYSQARQGEIMVSIEEAMNDAIDKVLSRISNYWKDDLKRGIQYKLIVRITTDFDEDEVEEIQFAFADAVEEISNNYKENVITNQTLDYLLWCDHDKYDKSSKVYRYIKKAFTDAELDAVLRRININRKMILLKIESE